MKINIFYKKLTAGISIALLLSTAVYGAAKADLSLTKTASVALVNQASALSYSLTLTNLSNSTAASGITVTDTLPSGMSYISSSGTDWSCSSAGSPVTVTCNLANLAKTTSSILTLNVTSPTSTASGVVTFTNTATVATIGTDDDVPGNNSGSVTVTLNRPPVAVNDAVATTSHTAVSGNVLTNDTDLDNDTKTVTSAGTHTLSFGEITINANGTFTYTPGYFTGETERYIYTISDGRGGTSTAELTISIASACNATGLVDASREFCLRKQTVLFGDMITVGNTVVVPPNPQPASGTNKTTYCSTYTTGAFSSDIASADNQSLYLCSYKPDAYLNATSAQVSIPAGSKIKWAGLYLQSVVRSSDTSSLSSMDIKIKNSTSGYVSAGNPTVINHRDYVNTNSRDYDNYSAFIDVTQVIKNWGSDTYTVANVPVTTDALVGDSSVIGKYGAWSLVIIYEEVSLPLKSISVYDGWKQITGSTATNITVDNFYTPTSGSIDSEASIFVGEGDKYRTGDRFKVGTTNLGTTDNAFDSGIISSGIRTPSLNNNQGIDIKTYQLGTSGYNLLAHNQNSITFSLSTVSPYDYYYPSMLAFSTEVYHPKMCYYEDIYAASGKLGTGAQVQKGSPLHVKVLLKNDQLEPAEKVMLYRSFDTNMPYTANSTGYNGTPADINSPTTPRTDSLDGDIFDYSTPLNLFSLHAGTGATYNQGGDFNPNQEALFDYNTIANFDGNRSITYQIAYTMPTIGFRYEGELAKCVDFNNTFGVIPSVSYPVGGMDVIETSYYNTAGNYAAANKNILTKIVKKPFNVEAVYLDENEIEKVYNGEIGNNKIINMGVMLYTTDTDTCSEERQLIWRGQLLHGASHVTAVVDDVDVDNADEEQGFTITNGHKNQRIKANFIDYGTLINAATDLTCSVSSLNTSLCLVPGCLNSDTQVLKAFPLADFPHVSVCLYGDGSGNTAPCDSNAYYGSCGGKKSNTIGPIKYNNDIGCAMCLADALGMNGCSTDNFASRPNDFNSSLTTGQQFQAGVSNAVDFYANKFGGSGTADYNESEIASPPSFVVDLNISDSTKTCAQPSLHFDPRVQFTDGLVSGSYKVINIGDFNVTMHEIIGSEYALVDADDTNDSLRLITPFMQQIKVIPHHFGLDGNFTNGSNGFTYLSNFEKYNTPESRNISAVLDFNITAQAVDNNTTSNYTESCYAKDGNVVMTLANALVINPVGSLTKMLWYDQNHDINGSIALGGTTYSMAMNATQFDSVDVNGTAQVKYLINFDRDQKLVVDPITMTINQVVATDTDLVSGTKVLTAKNSANYLYGRIIPRDVRVFGANTPFTANGWYEVFNTPAIGTTALPISKNSTGWSTNTLHNDANDGDGDVIVVITGANPVNTAAVNGVETYTFVAGYAVGGYKAHIRTAPWLWYGISALPYLDPANAANLNCLTHPCFNINVVPSIGATGSAKSTNEANKDSKRSIGGGAWQSTTDYAPAVR